MSIQECAIVLVDLIIITIEYSAIFTFIALVFYNVNISTTIALLLTITMIIGSMVLIQKVTMEEFYYSTMYDETGLVEKTIIGKNPNFPEEKTKKLCKSMLYIMPAGKATMVSEKLSPETDIENRRDYNNTILLFCSARKYNDFYRIRYSFI